MCVFVCRPLGVFRTYVRTVKSVFRASPQVSNDELNVGDVMRVPFRFSFFWETKSPKHPPERMKNPTDNRHIVYNDRMIYDLPGRILHGLINWLPGGKKSLDSPYIASYNITTAPHKREG